MKSFGFGAVLLVTLLTSCLNADETVSTTNLDGGYTSSGYFIGIGYTFPDIGFSNEAAAQEFFPEVSGRLTTLIATVDTWQGGEPLQVDVYTADESGFPDQHLGMAVIPEADVLSFGEVDWPLTMLDLSALEIDLVAGEAYVVTFRADNPIYQNTRYRALRTAVNANTYGVSSLYSPDFGATWFHNTLPSTSTDPVPPEIGLIVCVDEAGIPEPQEVAIDVDPESSKNSINLKTRNPRSLEVAVLADANLDVADVVLDSALLGDPDGNPVEPVGVDFRDVDSDGDGDLVYEFDVNEMKAAGAIDESTTSLQLVARLVNGGIIFGSDDVNRKRGNGHGPRNR